MSAIDFTARGMARKFESDLSMRTQVVSDRTALASEPVVSGENFYSTEKGREGLAVAEETSGLTTREAAARALDTSGDIFIPTNSAGITIMRKMEVIRPEELASYGDVDNSATCHLALQMAMRMAPSLGRKVVLDNRPYYTAHSVIPGPLARGLIVEGTGNDSAIINRAPSTAGMNKTTMCFGQMHPAYLASNTNAGKSLWLTWHGSGPLTAGHDRVILSAPADAANYAAGDLVIVRSRAYYKGNGSSENPHYATGNVVLSSNPTTGEVVFAYPVLRSHANSYLCNMSTPIDPDTATTPVDALYTNQTAPLFLAHKWRLYGFAIDSDLSHGWERGGMLDCDFDLTSSGDWGMAFNGAWFSRFKGSARGYSKGLELAMNCTRSRFDIDVSFRKTAASGTGNAVIQVGECSVDNKIFVPSMSVKEHDWASIAAISVLSSDGNALEFGTCQIDASYNGPFVSFSNPLRTAATDAGETQEPTQDNIVTFNKPIAVPTPQRFGYWLSSGGKCRRNRLEGHFDGAPNTTAFTFGGDENSFRGYFQSGSAVGLGTNTRFEGRTGTGTVTGYDRTKVKQFSLNGVEYMVQGDTATIAAATYNLDISKAAQTLTFTGANLQFLAPAAGSAEGMKTRVTLINGGGGIVTPTSNAQWLLGVQAWSPLEIGQVITFEVIRLPSSGGTRMAVLNLTPPA